MAGGGRKGLALALGGGGPLTRVPWGSILLCLLTLLHSSSGNEKCRPFPSGEMQHNVTGGDVTFDDVIQYDFRLELNLSTSVSRVLINVTATSLKFCSNDSRDSVTWQLEASNGTVFDRNSFLLAYTETSHEEAHELVLKDLGGDNYTVRGTLCMTLSAAAGAGVLVQSVLEITVTHRDNLTCPTCVHSPYFYLPPPRMWVSSDTPQPVPMMSRMDITVHLQLSHPATRLDSTHVQVRTPSEESSREVILTLQSSNFDHVTGFTSASTHDVKACSAYLRSTYSSFQNDVGEVSFPSLERDDANFSAAELATRFTSRTEDYSQLRNGDVVHVSSAVTLGGVPVTEWSGDGPGAGGGGAHLLWVSSLPVTLQAPPLELKQPDLALAISQKSSCAYDGQTRGEVNVNIEHSPNSTASAYNVTARVYLTEAMTLMRHVNSELRQNSLSVEQKGHVVNVDIARMTFSDPTTVTLDLDIDLSDPKVRLADHHVLTADAVFWDRWGHSTGRFTAMDYVDLKLDSLCSRRVRWTSASGAACTCSHDSRRGDCACCLQGACQCGDLNPAMCQPCHQLHLCRRYLHGFDAITQLDAGDGKTTFICAAYHFYRAWSKGISCYRRTRQNGSYTWTAVNPIVGAILSRDRATHQLYGVSNHGLAYMRSDDNGVTWFTLHPSLYQSQVASGDMENATLIYDGLEMQ